MISTFRNQGTEDVFNGVDSNEARRLCPPDVVRRARAKLFLLDDADILDDLRAPPGNRLEALQGTRQGQYSIRINSQYRICFHWGPEGPVDVEIVDYHR